MIPLAFRKLTAQQRFIFAEKLMDWANLIFIGLVVGQVVPGANQFKAKIGIVGVVWFVVVYFFAYLLLKGGSE